MPEEKRSSLPTTKKPKYNEKWINNVRMEYTLLKKNVEEGYSKYEYIVNNNTYKLITKFNEDRGKFQALVEYEDRKQSLSFFGTAKNALENLELYIALLNGGIREQKNNMVGD